LRLWSAKMSLCSEQELPGVKAFLYQKFPSDGPPANNHAVGL